MLSYDVIIVGAGPGGLRAAEILGNSNLSVLVVEKNAEIGPKVCAGGITHKGMEYFPQLEEEVAHHWNTLKFNSLGKNGISKSADIKRSFDIIFTIDRHDLGQWQLKRCQPFENIKILTNTRVSKIEKDGVIINNQKISFKYLIGADGSASLVKRYLNLPAKKKNIAYHYLVEKNEKFQDIEVFYDDKYFGALYGWIFPHKNYVSVGSGFPPNFSSSIEMRGKFREWINEKGIPTENAKYQAFSIDFDYHGYQFGNIYLVGDAAGLSSAFTGEGIYQAWISGDEVARLILDPTHNPKKLKEVIFYNKLHHIILKIFVAFSPKIRDLAYRTIRKLIRVPILTRLLVKTLL